MRGLPQKRVLVTGAAGGIGAATVRRFLQEGARVWAVDRDEAGLERLLATMAEAGHELDGVSRTDVSDEAQVAAAFEAIHEQWEQCDVVINNAGISERVPFLELTPASWRAMLDSNLTGIFLVAQAAARVMIEGEGGVIVNMGSMNAHIACSSYAHYNASKAGVVELTRTMALELAPAVRVLSISPGAVRTPMQEAEYTEEMFAELDGKIPLGRHARPDEVAALFAFVASDEAPYACGSDWILDGGESAGGLASG